MLGDKKADISKKFQPYPTDPPPRIIQNDHMFKIVY